MSPEKMTRLYFVPAGTKLCEAFLTHCEPLGILPSGSFLCMALVQTCSFFRRSRTQFSVSCPLHSTVTSAYRS